MDAIKPRVIDFKPKRQHREHLDPYDNKGKFLELLNQRKDEAVDSVFGMDADADSDTDTDIE